MKTRIITIGLIVMVVLNIILIAIILIGQPRQGHLHRERRGQHLEEQLGFDAQQSREFRDLKRAHFRENRELFRKMAGLKKQLLLSDDHLKAKEIIHEIENLQGQIDWNIYEHFQAVKSICHPNQLPAYADFIDQVSQGMEPGHRRRGNME